MSHQDDITAHSRKAEQAKLIIRVVRMSGGLFLIAGLLIFFEVAGLGELLGIGSDGGVNRMVGGALMFVGMMDIVIVPRVLEKIITR